MENLIVTVPHLQLIYCISIYLSHFPCLYCTKLKSLIHRQIWFSYITQQAHEYNDFIAKFAFSSHFEKKEINFWSLNNGPRRKGKMQLLSLFNSTLHFTIFFVWIMTFWLETIVIAKITDYSQTVIECAMR